MHKQPGKRLRCATLFTVEAATMVLRAAIIACSRSATRYACLITANAKKTQMVRRHARRLAVGSAARSAFTAQVAFAHLIVGFDASHPLQCPRAACRLAERTVLTSQRGSSTGSTMGLASIGPHASSSVLFRTQCTLTESGVATSFGAHLHNAIAACYISKI